MSVNLDIQNILVLKRMYELRNVRLVAESLGKTSGAISKNLTKMKTQLNDPLFVQTKNGFEPTAFVEANIAHFEQIINSIDSIKPQHFSPAHFDGSITIYANTLFWEYFGDKCYLELLKHAPEAKFSCLRWGSEAKKRLIDGENAIAIHYFDEDLPQSIVQTELGRGKAVFFVRQDHPAQNSQELEEYPFILFKTPGWNDYRYPVLERLKHMGFRTTPKVEIEHPAMIQKVLLQTNHFGITMSGHVPKGCRSIALPAELELDVRYVMSCRRSQQQAPVNQWLLDVIKHVAQS
ncbi:LysR substrate-binding domain-containing protein [Vibrio alginolyticus]